MIRQRTDGYVKLCVKAWLLCEANVRAEMSAASPRQKLVKELEECAKACYTVVGSLMSADGERGEAIINCLINCRSCSVECKKYPADEDMLLCSIISGICADCMTEIAVFPLN